MEVRTLDVLAHLVGADGKLHELIDHLSDVASRARDLAESIRTDRAPLAQMANWAGWLHDLGKYRIEFQGYLSGLPRSEKTQHSVFGAAAALKSGLPRAIAFAINGHHAGLHDWVDLKERVGCPDLDPLGAADRLLKCLQDDPKANLPATLGEVFRPSRKPGSDYPTCATHEEFLVRMLFSCLVDADFLDTERHMRGSERSPVALDPAGLLAKVVGHVGSLSGREGDRGLKETRRRIFDSCLEAAKLPSGLFSLTTPTGGGKTLAGLAFALKHAELRELRRVIIVIPFLSIIEQNAGIYRKVLGDEVVVEHHSAVARTKPSEDEPERKRRSSADLAAENWDAPVVVTTSVQFLESLFARSPSRCRKLHNIARSVVILDEVQTLPRHLLEPAVDIFRELAEHYGTSFVFCSATQPGFARSSGLPSGFQPAEVREIAPEPSEVFGTLGRVCYELPAITEPPWDWDMLIGQLTRHRQVLTILNLRRHVVEVYRKLIESVPPDEQPYVFHLSSAMCAEHRSAVLARINHALSNGLPCRVVSSQVVEAGVDVDFPAVYRALAPLDALIQSAGRCNREGKLVDADGKKSHGLVVVFKPADTATVTHPYGKTPIDLTTGELHRVKDDPSRLATDPTLYAKYYEKLLKLDPSDVREHLSNGQLGTTIQEDRENLNFQKVAKRAKVIEDAGQAVVVPYAEIPFKGSILKLEELSERKARYGNEFRLFRDDLRELQRFMVNLRKADIDALGGLVRPIADVDGPWVLKSTSYDQDVGVKVGELPPEDFGVFDD